jgi:hypothetical protein
MLEVDDLREHIGDGPSDDVLERFLAAAYQSIDADVGPSSAVASELLRPFGSLVILSRRASAVTSVREGDDVLATDDYALRPGGKYLQRRRDGRPVAWRRWVDVTYTPLPEDAERDRVAIKLVELDLAYQPGMAGSTIGPWNEQYMQGDKAYQQERQAILDSLRSPAVGVW